MHKTSVYLPDDLRIALKREAARRGVSEAHLIRSTLRDAVVRPAPSVGLFEAEPIAERTDDWLSGFGER